MEAPFGSVTSPRRLQNPSQAMSRSASLGCRRGKTAHLSNWPKPRPSRTYGSSCAPSARASSSPSWNRYLGLFQNVCCLTVLSSTPYGCWCWARLAEAGNLVFGSPGRAWQTCNKVRSLELSLPHKRTSQRKTDALGRTPSTPRTKP